MTEQNISMFKVDSELIILSKAHRPEYIRGIKIIEIYLAIYESEMVPPAMMTAVSIENSIARLIRQKIQIVANEMSEAVRAEPESITRKKLLKNFSTSFDPHTRKAAFRLGTCQELWRWNRKTDSLTAQIHGRI